MPETKFHTNRFFRMYFEVERFFRRTYNTSSNWVTLSPIGQLFTGMMGVTRHRLSNQIPKIERYFCNRSSYPAQFVERYTTFEDPTLRQGSVFHVRGHKLFTKFKLSGACRKATNRFSITKTASKALRAEWPPSTTPSANSTARFESSGTLSTRYSPVSTRGQRLRSMIVQAHEKNPGLAFEVSLLPALRPRLQPGAIPPLEIVEAAFVASTRIRNTSDAEKIDAIVGLENAIPEVRPSTGCDNISRRSPGLRTFGPITSSRA